MCTYALLAVTSYRVDVRASPQHNDIVVLKESQALLKGSVFSAWDRRPRIHLLSVLSERQEFRPFKKL
jgi:hypothetical protein